MLARSPSDETVDPVALVIILGFLFCFCFLVADYNPLVALHNTLAAVVWSLLTLCAVFVDLFFGVGAFDSFVKNYPLDSFGFKVLL